ncbi:MAG: hypothetical protein Q7K03_02110 [Dehalococcoidia bacterium]|nr:hypothetical protein [Dehalococcoidia bacterium]
MSISRKHAQDYAETVLSRPRSDFQVTLKRGKGGTTLLYQGRAVTKCHASRVGAVQAIYMARALGVELPPQGSSVRAEVPGGVLYRAVAVSTLDLRRPEARQVLAQLLATAEMQRTGMGSQAE